MLFRMISTPLTNLLLNSRDSQRQIRHNRRMCLRRTRRSSSNSSSNHTLKSRRQSRRRSRTQCLTRPTNKICNITRTITGTRTQQHTNNKYHQVSTTRRTITSLISNLRRRLTILNHNRRRHRLRRHRNSRLSTRLSITIHPNTSPNRFRSTRSHRCHTNCKFSHQTNSNRTRLMRTHIMFNKNLRRINRRIITSTKPCQIRSASSRVSRT